ncbi:MAG: type II toxin-antitoxin system RelE/ParE family toxin [Candidatus Brocadiaceae bacterium]|nr:type II toxin-antitoxin system RelE/ParE family toxin [Candidatus Brocadiaceae bacterium]
MSNFRIFETDEFFKQLKKMSSPNVDFLQKKLNSYVYPQIKNQPFWGNNIKKLQGYSPDTWRYRIGKFRLFYVVNQEERIISILTVDFRKDAYR